MKIKNSFLLRNLDDKSAILAADVVRLMILEHVISGEDWVMVVPRMQMIADVVLQKGLYSELCFSCGLKMPLCISD